MITFRQFLEQSKASPWVAKKADVISLWNSVRTDTPIQPQPVMRHHKGNRFDQDGIRVTGRSEFINSILSRLKPLLFYADHPSLDLDVKYRQVQKRDMTDRASFACYINVVQKKDK